MFSEDLLFDFSDAGASKPKDQSKKQSTKPIKSAKSKSRASSKGKKRSTAVTPNNASFDQKQRVGSKTRRKSVSSANKSQSSINDTHISRSRQDTILD